jgi:hypothetical protein
VPLGPGCHAYWLSFRSRYGTGTLLSLFACLQVAWFPLLGFPFGALSQPPAVCFTSHTSSHHCLHKSWAAATPDSTQTTASHHTYLHILSYLVTPRHTSSHLHAQIAGIGDSGLNTDSCFFSDPDHPVRFQDAVPSNVTGIAVVVSKAHRKLAQYYGFQSELGCDKLLRPLHHTSHMIIPTHSHATH